MLQRYSPRALVKVALSASSTTYYGATPKKSIPTRQFHVSKSWQVIRPFLLADIGEGITECQIVSWSVKAGDQVKEFDTICEVQSDKASVEITSRFDGVIKALHYDVDDMAIIGKPLLNIEVEDESRTPSQQQPELPEQNEATNEAAEALEPGEAQSNKPANQEPSTTPSDSSSTRHSSAVPMLPAVRRLLKEHTVDPAMIQATGKGGRIKTEDVHKQVSSASSTTVSSQEGLDTGLSEPPLTSAWTTLSTTAVSVDQVADLTSIEKGMFRAITQSLTIPHFLFTYKEDITNLSIWIQKVKNEVKHTSSPAHAPSLLAFTLKALSQVLVSYPKLNSHLNVTTQHPQLLVRGAHNFGIAVDTHGLLVPVIRNVQSRSISSLQVEIKRLSTLGRSGKLRPEDFQDATFSVSNIGSIGGDVVSPIIFSPMVGILGIGKTTHSYGRQDSHDLHATKPVQKTFITLSWSADYRIVDGATVAKTANLLEGFLTQPQSLSIVLR